VEKEKNDQQIYIILSSNIYMTGTNIMCIFTTLIFVDVVKLRNTYINVVLAKFSKYSTSIQRSFLKRKWDY
jgi:hypothetical protein